MPDLLTLYVCFFAVLGLLVGSFLNVCIYRIPRDLSVVAPRSFCPECGKPVAWYDNVPLLSYAILRGKCRSCAKAIGFRYPLVELTTAALFAATAIQYGWTLAALKWAVFEAILIVLFWTDLEERILPDELTLGGTVAGVILALFVMVPGVWADLLFPALRPVWRSLINAALGAVVLTVPIWLLGVAFARVRKREGLGLGDVKLLMLIGVFLGLERGVAAVLVGTVAGVVIGITYVLLTGKKASSYELPFGSFLCAGAAVVALVSW
ncbi:MAG: prepilin peptidase [Bryobacteraceae bacterium]